MHWRSLLVAVSAAEALVTSPRRFQKAARSCTVRSSKGDDDADAAESVSAMRRRAAELREEVDALERSMLTEQLGAERAAVDEMFRAADANEDGVVTLDELKAFLRRRLVDENENAYDAKKADRLLDGAQVVSIFKALDLNGDGVLQRSELVSLDAIRKKLEAAYDRERAGLQEKNGAPQPGRSEASQAAVDRLVAERVANLETVANDTSVPTRFVAAATYVLPLLDAVPYSFVAARKSPLDASLDAFATGAADRPPVWEPALDAIRTLAEVYHALPFSGLLVFLALSSLAGAPTLPRLIRFSARHSIVLDIGAALLIPLYAAAAPAPYDGLGQPFVETLVAASIIAALFGQSAKFIPISGQLTSKFTADFDAAINQVIVQQSVLDVDGPTMNRTNTTTFQKPENDSP